MRFGQRRVAAGVPFGGLAVLLAGDLYQLPPPGGEPLFAAEAIKIASRELAAVAKLCRKMFSWPPSRLANNKFGFQRRPSCCNLQVLWRQFSLVEFAGNHRAASDPAFADILSRVRIGRSTELAKAPLRFASLVKDNLRRQLLAM